MRPYLQLIRPANVVTALADVLAGYAIGGLPADGGLPWLLASTACLYAGGVVLNDVFDRHLDLVERPERPIPSGRVPAGRAAGLGAALLAAGVVAAFQAAPRAGLVAGAIAALVVVYDALAKRSPAFGPLAMGACRALNLVLGISVAPDVPTGRAALALLPFVYIWSVTALSRQEVHGGRPAVAAGAAAGVTSVAAALAVLIALGHGDRQTLIVSSLFAYTFAWRVMRAFWRAWRSPHPQVVRAAVRAGVLSIILLDATLAAVHAGPLYGAVVLSLSVVAWSFSRLFPVT